MPLELSKTDYLAYKECPKLLWFQIHADSIVGSGNESVEELSVEAKRRIRTGKEVGRLARSYFGKYTLINYNADFKLMCKETDEYIKQKEKVIAEASFVFNGNKKVY